MKRIAFALVMLSLGIIPLTADAELWRKASELYAKGKTLKPTEAHAVFKELDEKGRVVNLTESAMEIRYGADGEPVYKVLSLMKNGKDATNEMPKQGENSAAAKKNSRGGPQGSGANEGRNGGMGGFGFVPDETFPLDPNARASIEFLPGFSIVNESGKKFAVIPFEERLKTGKVQGSLKVEAESGRPTELRLSIQMPSPASGKFDYVFLFSASPSGGYVPSIQEFKGNAGFLLWKAIFEGRIEVSGYH